MHEARLAAPREWRGWRRRTPTGGPPGPDPFALDRDTLYSRSTASRSARPSSAADRKRPRTARRHDPYRPLRGKLAAPLVGLPPRPRPRTHDGKERSARSAADGEVPPYPSSLPTGPARRRRDRRALVVGRHSLGTRGRVPRRAAARTAPGRAHPARHAPGKPPACLDHLCSEQLAQLRDVPLHRLHGGRRRPGRRSEPRSRSPAASGLIGSYVVRSKTWRTWPRTTARRPAGGTESVSTASAPLACARGRRMCPGRRGRQGAPRAHRVRGGGHDALDAAMTSGRQPGLLDVGVFLGRVCASL